MMIMLIVSKKLHVSNTRNQLICHVCYETISFEVRIR